MACLVASNTPLRTLQQGLGLMEFCHSRRFKPQGCVHALPSQQGLAAIVGGALGSCQALMNCSSRPEEHTSKFKVILEESGMPWPESHELFWNYRPQGMSASEYFHRASKPLTEGGRVPVVITTFGPLDPGLQELIKVDPQIPPGETVLIRIILKDGESIAGAAALIQQILAEARQRQKMPSWWPLFQGNISLQGWDHLKRCLKDEWRFVNIAVNPFVSTQTIRHLASQVTVAQVPIGLADGMLDDGTITLASGMKITGATESQRYNLFEYFGEITKLRIAPTVIVLGPSQSNWSEDVNRGRIARIGGLLRRGVDILWNDVSSERRAQLISLPG